MSKVNALHFLLAPDLDQLDETDIARCTRFLDTS